MAKGKTQFTCFEKRIDRSKWRWTVTYLGECLGTGIVKTQAACRVEKNRVKREWLATHKDVATKDIVEALALKFGVPMTTSLKMNPRLIIDRPGYSENLPQQFVTKEDLTTSALRPV